MINSSQEQPSLKHQEQTLFSRHVHHASTAVLLGHDSTQLCTLTDASQNLIRPLHARRSLPGGPAVSLCSAVSYTSWSNSLWCAKYWDCLHLHVYVINTKAMSPSVPGELCRA